MAELRTILLEATSKSLVLIDELCRGTEVQKGTFIAASVIESLDNIGCIGILSTHLHDLLDMKLRVRNVVQKAMGSTQIDGCVKPTWKLIDGACRESLAFEVARKEGVPENVVQRAEELYRESIEMSGSGAWNKTLNTALKKRITPQPNGNGALVIAADELHDSKKKVVGANQSAASFRKELKDVMSIFNSLCKTKLQELSLGLDADKIVCLFVDQRQLPPPSSTRHSCVYMLQRPDGKFYVGQSDNLVGRIKQHRATPALAKAPFLYLIVANKSVASELETFLVNQLPLVGLLLVNKGDQKHKHFGTAPLVDAPPF